MLSTINYQKSIKCQRIIHRITLSVVYDLFFFFFIAIVSIGLITLPAIYKLKDVSNIPIWYVLFALLFDCWILVNIVLTNKLVKIHPSQKKLNKTEIKETILKFYPKVFLWESETNLLLYRDNAMWFSKDITLLQDKEILYINIAGLGRGDSVLPFHGLVGYLKCKQIARYLDVK